MPGSLTPHVLVKFSGTDASPTVTRWSDLLTCEQLALDYAQRLPTVVSARNRIIAHGGRTFLEVERFDRHGRFGRSPLISLETVNAALLGKDPSDWRPLADALVAARLLSVEEGRRIHVIWWFGRLIANTDMHLGNLSFRPDKGRLFLAPVYDMLPMLYAPLAGGEVPTRTFEPLLPLPRERDTWLIACEAAAGFWDGGSADSRISADFRVMVRDHGARLWAACERDWCSSGHRSQLQADVSHGLSTLAPVGTKCRRLRVATVRPSSRAVAAIRTSALS
ncbi:HipA domain-containing protein [Thiocapsa bogorovii]|uniref:HipA domain-containing protein n=1 Tax=Thiocapsa bogorovii TaxID=521689 RepID=UPI002FC933FD